MTGGVGFDPELAAPAAVAMGGEPDAAPDAAADRPGTGAQTAREWAMFVLVVAIFVFAIIMVVAPGVIASGSPTTTVAAPLQGPSSGHWFGTDQLGRDVLTRVIWGARPVLVASAAGVGISAVVGVAMGLAGGWTTGFFAGLTMRVLDVMLALPALLIALMVIAIMGTGVGSVIVAVGVAFIPAFARVVYAQTRALKAAQYVAAARLMGGRNRQIIVRHFLPNLATEVLVIITSAMGWAILTATTLSFLGFGVQLPQADWGVDLAAGDQYLSSAWWLSTFPGLAITCAILYSNFLGDYLAARIDPRRLRRRRAKELGVLGQRRRQGAELSDTRLGSGA